MVIPTEPIGSIPRPLSLIELVRSTDSSDPQLDPYYEEAIRDAIRRFEATGYGFSPFSDDTSTTRDTAFSKIRARVLGAALAAKLIGGG